MKTLAPGLKDYEIETVFNKFDFNGDKKIYFSEFKHKFEHGLFLGSEIDLNSEKVYKLAKNLRKIIIVKNIDLIFYSKNMIE